MSPRLLSQGHSDLSSVIAHSQVNLCLWETTRPDWPSISEAIADKGNEWCLVLPASLKLSILDGYRGGGGNREPQLLHRVFHSVLKYVSQTMTTVLFQLM